MKNKEQTMRLFRHLLIIKIQKEKTAASSERISNLTGRCID